MIRDSCAGHRRQTLVPGDLQPGPRASPPAQAALSSATAAGTGDAHSICPASTGGATHLSTGEAEPRGTSEQPLPCALMLKYGPCDPVRSGYYRNITIRRDPCLGTRLKRYIKAVALLSKGTPCVLRLARLHTSEFS